MVRFCVKREKGKESFLSLSLSLTIAHFWTIINGQKVQSGTARKKKKKKGRKTLSRILKRVLILSSKKATGQTNRKAQQVVSQSGRDRLPT
jgi:cell division protein FtsB